MQVGLEGLQNQIVEQGASAHERSAQENLLFHQVGGRISEVENLASTHLEYLGKVQEAQGLAVETLENHI